MKKLNVAINGFGRIGREIFRINLEKKFFKVVAINDLTDAKTLAHLLKYDSNYGQLKQDVSYLKDKIVIGKDKIHVTADKDPENLPWKKLKIDLVIESTGHFRTKELASKHLKAGAKRVIVTAPGENLDFNVVIGVNEKSYNPKKHFLISNASCTTNCLAPIVKIIHKKLGVEKALMTTIHSYTNDQNILDLPHKDLRRARAAGLSMIPTTTGAAQSVTETIPELKGKLNGISIRVPTPTVSLVDVTFITKKPTTREEVNKFFQEASKKELKGLMDYNEAPLVSVDFKGNSHSAIIDSMSTEVLGKNMVKVLAWYDNEWGYSSRIVDLVKIISDKE